MADASQLQIEMRVENGTDVVRGAECAAGIAAAAAAAAAAGIDAGAVVHEATVAAS
jgi:hypothetical protein